MLMNTGEKPVRSTNGLLTTVGYQIGNEPAVYCLEGSIAVTGALVQWLRDNLKIITTSQEVETLARTVEDNGDVYFVPAFSGLFAPYWRSDATRGHRRINQVCQILAILHELHWKQLLIKRERYWMPWKLIPELR